MPFRSRRFPLCSALLLFLIQLASPAVAASTRVAFVVGNGDYQHAGVLRNPANDAATIASALARVGFTVIEGRNLTRREFEEKIKLFTAELANASEAVFFYAGHGLQVAGQNYLIPVDAKIAEERALAFEAIPLDLIQSQMELEREDKTSIIFLDACRDNPFTRSLSSAMGMRSAAIKRGLAEVQAGSGTFIAFSTKPNDVASDGTGANSPFTQSLAARMMAAGRPLASVMIDVRNDVRRLTGNAQTPWDHSSLTGEFYFIPPEQGAGPSVATAAVPPDYEAIRRRNQELEKRLAAITQGGAATGAKPGVSAPAVGPGGCQIVERSLASAVQVQQGSRLCSRDGVNRAEIKLVNRYAIIYSVDGRQTTCKPKDICQFDWPNAPLFRVRLTETEAGGKVTAELVPNR